MKLIMCLAILALSFPLFADYKSEKKAIEKFKREVFLDEKNYLPAQPGQLPALAPKFLEQLRSDPVALKYFIFINSDERWRSRYELVKPFALSLEGKFEGKPLTPAQLEQVSEVVADLIFSDSNIAHKKAFTSVERSNAYFENLMEKLQHVTFR